VLRERNLFGVAGFIFGGKRRSPGNPRRERPERRFGGAEASISRAEAAGPVPVIDRNACFGYFITPAA
jgi:hypothetical protein